MAGILSPCSLTRKEALLTPGALVSEAAQLGLLKRSPASGLPRLLKPRAGRRSFPKGDGSSPGCRRAPRRTARASRHRGCLRSETDGWARAAGGLQPPATPPPPPRSPSCQPQAPSFSPPLAAARTLWLGPDPLGPGKSAERPRSPHARAAPARQGRAGQTGHPAPSPGEHSRAALRGALQRIGLQRAPPHPGSVLAKGPGGVQRGGGALLASLLSPAFGLGLNHDLPPPPFANEPGSPQWRDAPSSPPRERMLPSHAPPFPATALHQEARIRKGGGRKPPAREGLERAPRVTHGASGADGPNRSRAGRQPRKGEPASPQPLARRGEARRASGLVRFNLWLQRHCYRFAQRRRRRPRQWRVFGAKIAIKGREPPGRGRGSAVYLSQLRGGRRGPNRSALTCVQGLVPTTRRSKSRSAS